MLGPGAGVCAAAIAAERFGEDVLSTVGFRIARGDIGSATGVAAGELEVVGRSDSSAALEVPLRIMASGDRGIFIAGETCGCCCCCDGSGGVSLELLLNTAGRTGAAPGCSGCGETARGISTGVLLVFEPPRPPPPEPCDMPTGSGKLALSCPAVNEGGRSGGACICEGRGERLFRLPPSIVVAAEVRGEPEFELGEEPPGVDGCATARGDWGMFMVRVPLLPLPVAPFWLLRSVAR